MDVTEILNDGLKREYKVVVPAAEIDERVTSRVEELRRSVRMRGFRPGKVPANLVRRQYEKAILGEILEQTVNDSSQQALTDRGVRPALQPKITIETFAEGEGLSYSMAVEALPEIEPGNLSDLKLTRLKAEVTDEAVDEALRTMAEQQRNYAPVEEPRPAESGEALVIDFVGRIDGEAFEGGTAQGYLLELGSGRFIPGFEDQLIGAKPGDKRVVKVAFPEDYGAQELAGKDAEFDVEVKELRVPQPVEIDDAYAKTLGLDSLDALKAAMRERIERDYADRGRLRLKRELLDRLAERHDFEVPPGMVEQEFENIWRQLQADLERSGETAEEAGKDEEELRKEYRAIAERRVRLGLLLSEIGRANNIVVPQEEVNRAIIEQARRFPGQEKEVFALYRDNPRAMFELRAPLFEDKVVDFIVELAQVEERTVPVEELLRDPDAGEGEAKGDAQA